MGKLKNIIKPDWQAIVQNLYAWAIPIVIGVILSWWSKRGEWLPTFYSWVRQIDAVEIIKSTLDFAIPAIAFAAIVWSIVQIFWGIILIYQRARSNKSSPTSAFPKLEWSAIEYSDKNWYGDHIASYAAIRIENEIDCRKLVAQLVKVKSIGMGRELDMNKVNPTKGNLTWNTKDNYCILHVVQEYDETAEFVFTNGRRSSSLAHGNYEITILITGHEIQPTEIVKKLHLTQPHHRYRKHETGLQWI